VNLTISDNGRGMDRETLSRIFEPFFSTKQRGVTKGTGLGLSVVQGIVRQHGGHITCQSEPGKGTEFRIYFPAIDAPIISEKQPWSGALQSRAQTVLVVEDNIPVSEIEKKALRNAGYMVIVANNGQEALDCYRDRKGDISLVILDLLMPEMSGRDCLMELVKIDPSVRVLVASGFSPTDELRNEIGPLVKGFITKPFNLAELLNAVRSVLGGD